MVSVTLVFFYPVQAVGYQTEGLDNQRRNRCRLELLCESAVKTDGSLMPFQTRPAVWFWTPCSLRRWG